MENKKSLEKPSFYLPHEKQIVEYMKTIEHLKKQNQENPVFCAEIAKIEQKLELLKKSIYNTLSPWERVLIARHSSRPRTEDYIKRLPQKFIELHGDRTFKDDHSIIGGFANIDGIKCMLIGQEKGSDTESRMKRNFGMVSPEGFRKAMRLMKLAEKCKLPVVTLLDTPGAYPGLEAEQRGQGWVIANNLQEMSVLETPIISIVIGEGSSGGALGMGVGDIVAMLEHAYYSVISPEGCASILWKDASQKQEAAKSLKLNSEDLLELDVIDEILPEPLGGAHHHPDAMFETMKQFIVDKCKTLKHVPVHLLLEQRYDKFRKIGRFYEQAV